jgi:hypothetical protein
MLRRELEPLASLLTGVASALLVGAGMVSKTDMWPCGGLLILAGGVCLWWAVRLWRIAKPL